MDFLPEAATGLAPPEALCSWECECEEDEEYCNCDDENPNCNVCEECVEEESRRFRFLATADGFEGCVCDEFLDGRRLLRVTREMLGHLRERDAPRFLRAGGRGSGSSSGNAGNQSPREEDQAKQANEDANAEADAEIENEKQDITSSYKWWYIYGIVWFSLSAVSDMKNICEGRDLCGVECLAWIGGVMSIFWYLSGWITRQSFGGMVCGGDYVGRLSLEQ